MENHSNYENLFVLSKAIKEIPDIKLRVKLLALTNLNKQRVYLEEKMVKEINLV